MTLSLIPRAFEPSRSTQGLAALITTLGETAEGECGTSATKSPQDGSQTGLGEYCIPACSIDQCLCYSVLILPPFNQTVQGL